MIKKTQRILWVVGTTAAILISTTTRTIIPTLPSKFQCDAFTVQPTTPRFPLSKLCATTLDEFDEQRRQQQQQQPKRPSVTTEEFTLASTSTMTKQGRLNGGADAMSPLRMICDEQKEFEMKLGKAVDVLRGDYPDILTETPDFSIYHNDLLAVDPSGVTLQGLSKYKVTFRIIHTIVNLFYDPPSSSITFRLVYDWARKSIRVSWNVVLIPRSIYGGSRNKLHLDGISVYEVDRRSGLITKHTVEHLLLNGSEVKPVNGVFSALRDEIVDSDGIPVLGVEGAGGSGSTDPFMFEFREGGIFDKNLRSNSESSLFSVTGASSAGGQSSSASSTSSNSASPSSSSSKFDHEGFERKNATRRKFGLPPITREEYKQLVAQVRRMENDQQVKAASLSKITAERRQKEVKTKNWKETNPLNKIFGGALKDTCETNADCFSPEVCCDFGIKKMCCSSGLRVYDLQPGDKMPLRVPIPNGGGPDGM